MQFWVLIGAEKAISLCCLSASKVQTAEMLIKHSSTSTLKARNFSKPKSDQISGKRWEL